MPKRGKVVVVILVMFLFIMPFVYGEIAFSENFNDIEDWDSSMDSEAVGNFDFAHCDYGNGFGDLVISIVKEHMAKERDGDNTGIRVQVREIPKNAG